MDRSKQFIHTFNQRLERISSNKTAYSMIALSNDLATAKVTGVIDSKTYNNLLTKIER